MKNLSSSCFLWLHRYTEETARVSFGILPFEHLGKPLCFCWCAQKDQKAHGKQIRSRDHGKRRAETIFRHDSAGDHGPKRNRNKTDKIIKAECGIEKLFADEI